MDDTAGATGDEAALLWAETYRGEALGEAYFRRVAEQTADPALRAKVELLACLERCTKELVEPVITRLGIDTGLDQATIDAGGSLTEVEYLPMLAASIPVAAEYIGRYTRLRTLAEPVDVAIVDQLIAHELAFEVFARRELAGETDASTEPIRALSHVKC